ncbi:nucleotidyltransferase domain-containing protein [Methyloceanibacter marginalis]|nr:nucleotidyltransferase [Methyloceanibacter marginalis]
MLDKMGSPPLGPTAPVGETLLAGVAIAIELPPSQHQLAVERWDAVRGYIERHDSPLAGRVQLFYPQGSMAIRSTIKSRKRADGFDIDVVAELSIGAALPAEVLNLLFQAINGKPGSRYHGMVERQSRCVTVYYSDGMHLDITPSQLVDENDPRRSFIFHAKAEEPASLHRRILMNSYGFVERFNTNASIDLAFAMAYAKRVQDSELIRAEAESKPVPSHSTIEGGKSSTVVALQLLKRNRNIRYEKRPGRIPPSVMMACFALEAAVPGNSIGGALEAISACMLSALEQANKDGVLVDVRNPACMEERFTDRWPENLQAQRICMDDLRHFRSQLAGLFSEQVGLDKKRDLLVAMFGESPAQTVVNEYAARMGRAIQGGERSVAKTGRVITGLGVSTPAIIRPALSQPRSHTFYGTATKNR